MPGSRRLVVASLALVLSVVHPAHAAQNDAGSGTDAGDTFGSATPVTPSGRYEGALDRAAGDGDDYYKFFIAEGAFLSVLIEAGGSADPMTMLDPNGIPIDAGTRFGSIGLSASGVLSTQPLSGPALQVRLAVYRAVVAGEYRLHLQAKQFNLGAYELCFMNCDQVQMAPIELIFGGSLPTTDTQVLLIPPSHGDLGNPLGPTVAEYLDATLSGIRAWETALDKFAGDYPQFSYLRQITVDVEIFDGVTPVYPAGYDVIIGYVAAGPAFRGVASDTDPDFIESLLRDVGLAYDDVHYSGRVIALSLFGSSPRAGQPLYDFPELNDLEIVTMHEFGHTFGLGHTTTWHPVLGADLMNSPAPFVYGDGSPAGDGGERTAMKCLSSLNLYGMAELYAWIPGQWMSSRGFLDLPPEIPYTWYC